MNLFVCNEIMSNGSLLLFLVINGVWGFHLSICQLLVTSMGGSYCILWQYLSALYLRFAMKVSAIIIILFFHDIFRYNYINP